MISTLVLDVSAAAEFVMNRDRSGEIQSLLEESTRILVPSLYRYEVTNLFWKYHSLHDVPLPQCQSALEKTIRLPDSFVNGDALYEETFKTATLTAHVSYDIFYLVVAQRNNGILATMDTKLRSTAKAQDVRIFE